MSWPFAGRTDTDVLIIGAGPVGLTLALLLSQFGIHSRIIDSAPAPVETSNALVIHARTLELFTAVNLAERMMSQGHWIEKVEIHAGGRVLVHADFRDLRSMYRGVLSLPQNITERILTDELRSRGIAVERPVRFESFEQDNETVLARLEHNDGSREAVRASWMAGCDGAHSDVRHALKCPFKGNSHTQRFVLADLIMTWPLPQTQISVFLHREGPIFAIPLPQGHHRLIAEITGTEGQAGEIDFEALRTMFARRVPVSGTLSNPAWISSFEVHKGMAPDYQAGRVFLAGDAAHVHGPAGGQGMNTGIQDAFNLGWKLALVHQRKARPEILGWYGLERMPIARAVIDLSDRMFEAAAAKNLVLERIRDLAIPLLAGSELFQQSFISDLSEIRISYRHSGLVGGEGHFRGDAPHPGDRAPMAMTVNGRPFYEFLEPTAHNLLLFSGETDSTESFSLLLAARRDFQAAYSGLIRAHVITPFGHRSGPGIIVDERGSVHRSYGVAKASLFLIRPDLYIAYRSTPPDNFGLHQFVRETYGFAASHGAAQPH